MQIKISIIVPVYKVEEYLPRCLRSIAEQTVFDDLEVLLVDDGSTDGCGALCDEFAAGRANVRVIHKVNGGLSDARNVAMRVASGDYFLFVDSDDFIRRDACDIVLKYLDEERGQIVSACATCSTTMAPPRRRRTRPSHHRQ